MALFYLICLFVISKFCSGIFQLHPHRKVIYFMNFVCRSQFLPQKISRRKTVTWSPSAIRLSLYLSEDVIRAWTSTLWSLLNLAIGCAPSSSLLEFITHATSKLSQCIYLYHKVGPSVASGAHPPLQWALILGRVEECEDNFISNFFLIKRLVTTSDTDERLSDTWFSMLRWPQ